MVSPVSTLAEGEKPDFATHPAKDGDWTPLPAETGGLVNISRRYGLPEGRSLVWLRTTVRAAAKSEKRAAIGWNDEVWVFVNGKQVFADVNDYLKPELRKTAGRTPVARERRLHAAAGCRRQRRRRGRRQCLLRLGADAAARRPVGRYTDRIDPMSERADPVGLLPRSGVGRTALLAVFWTVIGVIFALPNIGSRRQRPARAGLLAHAVVGVGADRAARRRRRRRLPFSDRQLARRLAAHVVLSLVFTVLYVYVAAALRAAVHLIPWDAVFTTQLITNALSGMYLWGWLIYWVILGGWLALNYYERFVTSELRRERLERRFSEARLNNLRLQLDPHFLFNALNTVSAQVDRDPRLARRMIEHLGDLLRLSLDSKDRQEVTLTEELAFLDHYLAIQRIRFGDNLRIETDVAPDVRLASVPSLILQPLVENAVRHGLASRASGGTVTVTARPAGDRLEIRVEDDGVGLPQGWELETGAGVGLSVTRERIAELHPNGSSRFAVTSRFSGGTNVDISLPLRLVGESRA